MDLHAPAPAPPPESDDGLYDLAESAPANGHAPANGDEAATATVPANAEAQTQPADAGKSKKTKKAEAASTQATAPPAPESAEVRKKKRRRRKTARVVLPAWGVSAVIHLAILGALAAATLTAPALPKMLNLDSALVANAGGADELVKVYAEPTDGPKDQAVGGGTSGGSSGGDNGGGGGTFGGIGTGAPTATPRVGNGGGTNVNEKTGLPGVGKIGISSGLALSTLAAPSMDLGGGGGIAGDVTAETKDVGAALDQIANEILRHLSQHKLTIVWMFDESGSMKDDQAEIWKKFDRVSSELKVNAEAAVAKESRGRKKDKDAGAPLSHAIVGFGKEIHYEIKKPTANIDLIGERIKTLRIDDSGAENTMHALGDVINTYAGFVTKERKLLIVLVTDESGDDGAYVEEARQMAVQQKVPIYVIGRQALFGAANAHLLYIDPITKDHYWPVITRGPETADFESLQYDGLHDRWDEQPSGFAPYELARLAKDTGGIYFLLPSEENMRVRQREQRYSIKEMKEYVPDYEGRAQYVAQRNKSEFRRSLYEIIQLTRYKSEQDPGFIFRRHFPIDPAKLVPACMEAGRNSNVKLDALLKIEGRLLALAKLRDREPEKRWQAAYDLMLAQIVAYQVKAFEYGATLSEMAKSPPRPKKMPGPDLIVEWVIDHSPERKAAKNLTEKKYLEATKLLKEVIAKHPKTPWADLAQDELNHGLGCMRNEWSHNPKYDERAKLVPKY